MSENFSESCYSAKNACANDPQTMKSRKENTAKLAAVALGTALLLSLIGAFNLNSDVKLVTNSQVPYIEQRIDNITPGYIAAVNQKRGM